MFHTESHTTGADLIDSNSGELVYRLKGSGALEVAHKVAEDQGHIYFDIWILGDALDQSPGVRVSWSSLPMTFNPPYHFAPGYRCGADYRMEVPA